jgi:uncharacterized protein (DUF2147 family)
MNLKQKVLSITLTTLPMVAIVDLLAPTAAVNNATASPSPTTTIAQASSPSFIGRAWESENKKVRVQFFKQNNAYNAKIVWLADDAQKKDVKNPDPKLRSRNLVGTTMFQGFTYDAAKKQLTGGVVYVPELGKLVKPKLSVVSDDRIEMQVSMGFMSRTVALTAVK